MTLPKDMICLVKKPELVWASLKQQTRYFSTFENNEEGSAQVPGLQRAGLLTRSLEVLLSPVSVYLSCSMGNTSLHSFNGRTLTQP